MDDTYSARYILYIAQEYIEREDGEDVSDCPNNIDKRNSVQYDICVA